MFAKRFIIAVLVTLVLASFVMDAEACGRRRRRPRIIINRPPPVPITPPPTPNPTPRPTPKPTAFPTKSPTKAPTDSPTKAPTPSPTSITGFVPTPPSPSTPKVSRNTCVRRPDYTLVPSSIPGAPATVKESQIYDCEQNICVTIDLQTTTEVTPCACGAAISTPKQSSAGIVSKTLSTKVLGARVWAMNELSGERIEEIDAFSFVPFQNTTSFLVESVEAMNGDYQRAIAGFAGLAQPFPQMPDSLNTKIPGNENNVAALCFTVKQTYESEYEWPEPPLPILGTVPNVYVTDCIPYEPKEPFAFRKREDEQTTLIYRRDFLLLVNDQLNSNGFNPRSRYITSYYLRNTCDKRSSYVSMDRHFVSSITRNEHSYGLFRWERTYTDVFVVGGAPTKISSMAHFMAKQYHTLEWWEQYARDENTGGFRTGWLYRALLGQPDPRPSNDPLHNPNSGPETKLCDSVPAEWEACQPIAPGTPPTSGVAPCAYDYKAKPEGQTVAYFNETVFAFPTWNKKTYDDATNLALSKLFCVPQFERCEKDITHLSFINFGGASRDFDQKKESHLVTGPREDFCGEVQSLRFDHTAFKPYKYVNGQEKGMLKRDSILEPHHQKRQTEWTQNEETGEWEIPLNNVVPEAVPQTTEAQVRAAVGSADQYGTNQLDAGDHPVALFPETYTVPVSVDPDNVDCGEFVDGTLSGAQQTLDGRGCVGKQFEGVPPCLVGQLGCNCRAESAIEISKRPACDYPFACNELNYCVRPTCPAGEPGCECAAGQCSTAGTVCQGGVCIFDTNSCPRGQAGCMCTTSGVCNGGATCNGGLCFAAQGAAAGASGAACTEAGACNDGQMACSEVLGTCIDKAFCETGTRGCRCEANRCESGFECLGGVCQKQQCPSGAASCPCLSDNTCSDPKYDCLALTKDGQKKACLAKVDCGGDQSERCRAYCGAGNVAVCPSCTHEIPECYEDPTAAAPRVVPTLLALLAIVLAAML